MDQVEEDFREVVKFCVYEDKLRQAHLTPGQQTQALSNFINMARKTAFGMTSALISASSMIMLTQTLLFGPDFFKLNTSAHDHDDAMAKYFLIPGMTPPLLTVFLTAGMDEMPNGQDFSSLKIQCFQVAVENLVFYLASQPEITQKLVSSEVPSDESAVEIILTPSLLGQARTNNRRRQPRSFIIQLLLIPLQSLLNDTLTTAPLVIEAILQCFDLVRQEGKRGLTGCFFRRRTTDRLIGNLPVSHPFGIALCAEAAINQPQNSRILQNPDFPMGMQYESALFNLYHKQSPLVPPLFDEGLAEPSDMETDIPTQPNSLEQWRGATQVVRDNCLVPPSAPYLLTVEGEKEYPLAAENGVQVAARPQQPEIRQTESEVTAVSYEQEATPAPDSFPSPPVSQGMMPANQQFRGMQWVEKLDRSTDFNSGNMSDFLPEAASGPAYSSTPLDYTSFYGQGGAPVNHPPKTRAELNKRPMSYLQSGTTGPWNWPLGALDTNSINTAGVTWGHDYAAEGDSEARSEAVDPQKYGHLDKCCPFMLSKVAEHPNDPAMWNISYERPEGRAFFEMSPQHYPLDRPAYMYKEQGYDTQLSPFYPTIELLNSLPVAGIDTKQPDVQQIREILLHIHFENLRTIRKYEAMNSESSGTPFDPHRLSADIKAPQLSRQLLIIQVLRLRPEAFNSNELQWLAKDVLCDADFELPAHRRVFNKLCSVFKVCFNAQAPSTPWICVAPVQADIKPPQSRTLKGSGFLVISTRETAAKSHAQARSTHVSNLGRYSVATRVAATVTDTWLKQIPPGMLRTMLVNLHHTDAYLHGAPRYPVSIFKDIKQYYQDKHDFDIAYANHIPQYNDTADSWLQLLLKSHPDSCVWSYPSDTSPIHHHLNTVANLTPQCRPRSNGCTIYTTPYSVGLTIPRFRPYGRRWSAFEMDTQGCCRDFQFLLLHGIDTQAPQEDDNV